MAKRIHQVNPKKDNKVISFIIKTEKPSAEKVSFIFAVALVFPAQGPPVRTIFAILNMITGFL